MSGAAAPVLLAAAAAVVAVRGRPPGAVRLAAVARRQDGPAQRVRSPGWSRPQGRGLAGRVGALLGRRRALERERARAVEACAALAGELRAGRPLEAGLQVAASIAVGPTGRALRAAAAAPGVGGDVVERLLAGATSTGCPELLRGLAACWQVCSTTGSGLAAALERLDEAERDAQERRRAVAAELAGPRATARLLAGLPLLGLLFAAVLGASPVRFLLLSPLGLTCLTAGAVLDVAGVLWTRRIVARAEAAG